MHQRCPHLFARSVVLLTLVIPLVAQAVVHADAPAAYAVSVMDRDTDGWTVDNGALAPVHVATGGASGGYVSATDAVIGPRWYWIAPPMFLGDASESYNKTLRFYLRQSTLRNQLQVQRDVVLTGADMSIYYDAPQNPHTSWTLYSIPLEETAGWKHEQTDQPVSQAELQAVLASLSELRIEGDYAAGVDTTDLDEVLLGAEPVRQVYLPLLST